MTDQSKTGKVISKSGKVTARNIVTGIDIQGAAGDEVLKAALEAMQHLQTGQVSGAKGVEATGEIITSLRYLNPQAPDRDSFVAELQALRQELVAEPDLPTAFGWWWPLP